MAARGRVQSGGLAMAWWPCRGLIEGLGEVVLLGLGDGEIWGFGLTVRFQLNLRGKQRIETRVKYKGHATRVGRLIFFKD